MSVRLASYLRLQNPNRVDLYDDKDAPETKFRMGRFARLMPMIDDVVARKGSCRIADLGGTEYYWHVVLNRLRNRDIKVTMINIDPTKVTVPEIFQNAPGDATVMSEYADNSFDLVHSNSVVEHVGGWDNMKKFAANVRRLAPAYFVQTPNFWFPVEPHFRSIGFHWLPEQVRYRRIMRRQLGFFDKAESVDAAVKQVQFCQLIDKRQVAELFPDARIEEEKFLGLTKSFMAIRERVA